MNKLSVSVFTFSMVFLAGGLISQAEDIYSPMRADLAQKQVNEWVQSQPVVSATVKEKVAAIWKNAAAEDLSAQDVLDKVVESFMLVNEPTKLFHTSCVYLNAPLKPPADLFDELDFSNDFYSNQMNAYYGAYLAKRNMYDEALWSLEELDPKTLVDPASALFFKAVAQQQLFLKADGLKTLDLLLKNTEDVPHRYQTIATLMQFDMQQLKAKSLGHVAHKMNDSRRRLDLARGGQRVQKVQGEITTLLDEIIEKMEQQQGGGGGGGEGAGESKSNESSNPANDSKVKGTTAPGNVDKRNFRDRNLWGDLPPKEEARAENIINRNFPSHYRKAIEEYSKRLAKRPQKTRQRAGSRTP